MFTGIAQTLGNRSIQTQRDLYCVHNPSVRKVSHFDTQNHAGVDSRDDKDDTNWLAARHSRDTE